MVGEEGEGLAARAPDPARYQGASGQRPSTGPRLHGALAPFGPDRLATLLSSGVTAGGYGEVVPTPTAAHVFAEPVP